MTRLAGSIEQQRARTAGLLAEATVIAADHALRDGRPRALPVILLPANPRPLVIMPVAARKAFVAHLDALLKVAYSGPVRDNALPMSAEDRASRANAGDIADAPQVGDLSAPMIAASCGTCRGACCTAGGTHAFLRQDSITRVRARLAEQGPDSPADLAATYLRYLPAQHYRGSCVYHADTGCALPRDLRANLCNRYLCGELTQLRDAVAGVPAGVPREVYVGAADGVRLHRVTHLAADADGGCHAEAVPLTPEPRG